MPLASQVILFCYLFIAGIALAMREPLDASAVPVLKAVTAGILALAGLFLYAAARRPVRRGWTAAALALAGLALGYTRHLAADTEPDARVGYVNLGGDRAFHLRRQLPDTARLVWRKTSELGADVRLRVSGELDARVPVLDARGSATLDAQGRWRFNLLRQALTSEVVTLRQSDPVGTEYDIPQPFTRVHGIELIEGPGAGHLALQRRSNHLGSFSRASGGKAPVRILGRIAGDPLVYDFKTVLPITPQFIQYPAGGPYFRVTGGDAHVTVRPDMTGYAALAGTESYGWDVQVEGELSLARGTPNPGGFDARQFMANYDIFGLMSVFQPPGGEPPLRVIAPEGGKPRRGSGIVEFSLDLRDRILHVIKHTMPYPQSAFLGGVTLGLRYGLPSTPCLLNGEMRKQDGFGGARPGVRGCEELVVDEFKAAGVNHVLAVSGLHVTIITAMFVGIFTLLRMPRQVYVPFIILALVVFSIITGARPSTLRAVIMNGLFLLTWAYAGQGFRSSALLGVPVAAFLILIHNPLVLVDPSFTLSFGAILSLALLTGPFQDLLVPLRGNRFAVFLLLVTAWTFTGMRHWGLAVTPSFLLLFALAGLTLFAAGEQLQARGIGLPAGFSYSSLPQGISTFVAAQFGIQIGMMIPLSAFYFARWPFAGAYANLIAIPLIGVVVQLAAIGGLLGIIPIIGMPLALLLGAANWLAASFFMWIAHASAAAFPYPFVRRPDLAWLFSYYALCAVFIWHRPLWVWLKAHTGGTARRAGPVAAASLALLTLPAWLQPPRHPQGELRMTFLSVGYGGAVLVESPGGRNVLVDTGFVEHERGRRNEAIRTVLPYLSYRGIRHLDGLILLSPRAERTAGASQVLDLIPVERLLVPPALTNLDVRLSPEAFAAAAGFAPDDPAASLAYRELIGDPAAPSRPSLAKSLARRGDTLANRWSGWRTRLQPVQAGMALYEESTALGPFRIEVLNPPPGAAAADNCVALRIVHGTNAVLLAGDLDDAGVHALLDRAGLEALRARVLALPQHGAALPADARGNLKGAVQAACRRSLAPLLDAVQPERVLFEFGNPRPVLGDAGRDARNAMDLTRQYLAERLGAAQVLSTDTDLAVTIRSSPRGFDLQTQARAGGAGEADAVSDISVGF